MQSKSKIQKVAGSLLGFCLLMSQTTYAEDKPSSCQSFFAVNGAIVTNVISQSRQRARENLFPEISYISGTVLDQNNTIYIYQALSVSRGNGAAIIDINPFTPELAEKIRQAIHEASSDPKRNYANRNGLSGLGFHQSYYEEDWKDFKAWLLEKQQIISSEEIDQFQQQVDEYLHQVKQLILRTDRQNIKLKFFVIRTDKILYFTPGHRHTEPEYDAIYLTASIAPVGLGTYYVKSFDGKQQRVLPRSGHTVIMSDRRRMKTFAEEGYLPVFHGTPHDIDKRLIILSVFEKSD